MAKSDPGQLRRCSSQATGGPQLPPPTASTAGATDPTRPRSRLCPRHSCCSWRLQWGAASRCCCARGSRGLTGGDLLDPPQTRAHQEPDSGVQPPDSVDAATVPEGDPSQTSSSASIVRPPTAPEIPGCFGHVAFGVVRGVSVGTRAFQPRPGRWVPTVPSGSRSSGSSGCLPLLTVSVLKAVIRGARAVLVSSRVISRAVRLDRDRLDQPLPRHTASLASGFPACFSAARLASLITTHEPLHVPAPFLPLSGGEDVAQGP